MRLRGGDHGFTVVELLVAISILGVITIPLGNVVISYLRSTDATTARLIESHDVQIASAYWAQDVASIGARSTTSPYALIPQSVETDVAYDSGLYPCGTAGTVIVRLAWDDFSGADATPQVLVPTQVRVAYVIQTNELHRFRCNGSAVAVSDVTIARPVTLPTVACTTTCTLTLTLKDPQNLGPAWVVRLTGQRRQS